MTGRGLGVTPYGTPRVKTLRPERGRAAITHAWVRVLRAHTRRGGAILLIEDLHWACSALIAALIEIEPAAVALRRSV